MRAHVAYADVPPAGEPRFDASGVAWVVIRWGDGTRTRLKPHAHFTAHVYHRRGRYQLSVLATDRAGNQTRRVLGIRVAS